jgi:hypothetical protein
MSFARFLRDRKASVAPLLAGITLYMVQVNTDGDPTSTLLQNCPSNLSKFLLLTSANAFVTIFSTIGTQLSNLRVAK